MGWIVDKVREILKPVELAGGEGDVVVVEITRPNNATAYTANDVLNDQAAGALEIPGVARKPGGSFWLNAVEIITDQGGGAQTWQPVIWLFRNPRDAALADNAVYSLTYIQQKMMRKLDRLQLPAFSAPAATTIDMTQLTDIARRYKCAPDRTSVFFEPQTLTAFTPSAYAQYAFKFHITRD